MGSSSQVMLGGVASQLCRNVCREGRILSSGSSTSLIPTSLAFLSTTSSSEAQEALKHVDRLDRNRDGTKRLNYAIVGPSELATVNKLLYATYHPYEPLTSHLGLCKGPNSIKDMDKMVESYLVKNLIRRSILLAGCLGFRAIKTEATGRFSKETFQRVGMQPAGSIKYDDFVFEGRKPFAGMKDGNSEITFMKKKFFQSSLRHIL